MKLTNILFDLDGTLIDSRLGIFNCFKHAFFIMGKRIPSDAELCKVIGPPLDKTFRENFGLTEEEAIFALKTYRERYAVKGILECEPIAGAQELLSRLHKAGYTVMLATSKPEPYAKSILENLGWSGYFDVVCGSDFEVSLKTKADVIEEALRRAFVVNRSSCAIVGDRKFDVEGGKKCSLVTVGVKTGFAEPGELEGSGASFVAENFDEVWNFIRKSGE